jgi:hypothetical protein
LRWLPPEPGAVERHVQAAEGRDRPLDHGRGLVLVGDIAADSERSIPGGGQLVGGDTKGLVVDVGQTTAAPASAKAWAVASPIPELAPVTRATWPVKS